MSAFQDRLDFPFPEFLYWVHCVFLVTRLRECLIVSVYFRRRIESKIISNQFFRQDLGAKLKQRFMHYNIVYEDFTNVAVHFACLDK